tara:strand:- start:31 stop:528 length:498 start_codon:yes stop_codon:yes gene_type:complete
MVIWLIGISGSGKTFYGKKLYSLISKKKKVIHIDGDEIRKYINYKLKYSKKDREKNSLTISDLCNFLEKKGFIVICSILSIFKKHQIRNRKLFKKYIQIYIKTDVRKVIERNNKNIYSKKDVVGKGIKFPTPYRSDITITNDFDNSYKKNIKLIIKRLNEKLKNN